MVGGKHEQVIQHVPNMKDNPRAFKTVCVAPLSQKKVEGHKFRQSLKWASEFIARQRRSPDHHPCQDYSAVYYYEVVVQRETNCCVHLCLLEVEGEAVWGQDSLELQHSFSCSSMAGTQIPCIPPGSLGKAELRLLLQDLQQTCHLFAWKPVCLHLRARCQGC